jgi:hypothetical protein
MDRYGNEFACCKLLRAVESTRKTLTMKFYFPAEISVKLRQKRMTGWLAG